MLVIIFFNSTTGRFLNCHITRTSHYQQWHAFNAKSTDYLRVNSRKLRYELTLTHKLIKREWALQKPHRLYLEWKLNWNKVSLNCLEYLSFEANNGGTCVICLGVCSMPLRTPTPSYPILWPIIYPSLVHFGDEVTTF